MPEEHEGLAEIKPPENVSRETLPDVEDEEKAWRREVLSKLGGLETKLDGHLAATHSAPEPEPEPPVEVLEVEEPEPPPTAPQGRKARRKARRRSSR